MTDLLMCLQNKDGFLTSDDLTSALGHTEDVKQLIAAADKNNDGGALSAGSLALLLESASHANRMALLTYKKCCSSYYRKILSDASMLPAGKIDRNEFNELLRNSTIAR